MIHTKTMIVDGVWSVVGSTNFDNRSFGLNDEINLAGRDEGLAMRLAEDFATDLAASVEITYDEWRRRSIFERIHECSAGVGPANIGYQFRFSSFGFRVKKDS